MLAKCESCPLNGRPQAPPQLRRRAKLAIIYPHPHSIEAIKKRLLLGPANKQSRKWLEVAGIDARNCQIMTVMRCNPPKDATPQDLVKAAACCRPQFLNDLNATNTQAILAYDKLAIKAVCKPPSTGAEKMVGTPLPSLPDIKAPFVMGTYSPVVAVYAKPWLKMNWIAFAKRAQALAEGQLGFWQWKPKLYVEPTKEALEALKHIANHSKPVGFDIETCGSNPMVDTISCMGVTDGDVSVSLPWETYDTVKFGLSIGLYDMKEGAQFRDLFRTIITNPKRQVVMQNGNHEILSLRHREGWVFKNGFDTMLAHAAAWPEMAAMHDLETIAIQYFPIERWKLGFKVSTDAKGTEAFVQRDPIDLRTYNAHDCEATLLIKEPLEQDLELYPAGWDVYHNLLTDAAIAQKTRENGIMINEAARQKHHENFVRGMKASQQQLDKIATIVDMPTIAATNTNHLITLFYGKLGCRARHFTEKGSPAVHKDALALIMEGDNLAAKEAVKHVVAYKAFQKLDDAYVRKLPVDDKGFVHPTQNVHGARTGRSSYTGPAIQTIPKSRRGQTGIRDIFQARPGNYVVTADWAQAEVRLMAMYSQDKKLLEVYARNGDVHTENTIDLFGADDIKNNRPLGKMFGLAVNYSPRDRDIAAKSLWGKLRTQFPGLEFETVRDCVYRWWEVHDDIWRWREEQYHKALTDDYVEEPLSGRRRRFFGRVKDTQVFNFPNQSGGAFLMGHAFRGMDRDLDQERNEFLWCQVHDELACEGPDPLRLARLLKKNMEQTHMGMFYPVDFKIGRDWGNMDVFETIEEIEAKYG